MTSYLRILTRSLALLIILALGVGAAHGQYGCPPTGDDTFRVRYEVDDGADPPVFVLEEAGDPDVALFENLQRNDEDEILGGDLTVQSAPLEVVCFKVKSGQSVAHHAVDPPAESTPFATPFQGISHIDIWLIAAEVEPLTLTSICAKDWPTDKPMPDGEKGWRIHNPNSFTVTVWWERYGASWVNGVHDAPPGDSYFSTPDTGQPNTTIVRWLVFDGYDQETKAAQSCILPVELTSFEAVRDGHTVRLVWETASETNNAGFDIQWAPLQGAFETIAHVEGRGTTSLPHAYQATVEAPGAVRFRLRQVDFDGTFEYSPVLEVSAAPVSEADLSLYPTPTAGPLWAHVQHPRPDGLHLQVIDTLGRTVRTVPLADSGRQQKYLDLSGLGSGMYIIRVLSGRGPSSSQMVLLQ